MTIIGVDVSENQTAGLPWAAWYAAGARVAVVRASIGFREDVGYERFVTLAHAAGFTVGAYHALLGHQYYDPTRQAADFFQLVMPQIQFCVLDIEAPGTAASDVATWCDYFDAHSDLPLLLYGNMALEQLLGVNPPRYANYGLWVADYGPGTPTSVPLNKPRIPRVGNFRGHQYAGNNGELKPYQGAIDLTSWTELPTTHSEAPVITPNYIRLGPHHMQGGNATGNWLKLKPRVAKFETTDLGASVEALPGTLALGRANDFGHLGGQGFDPNRQRLVQTPAQALEEYKAFLQPYIDSNPHILAWEGPNEPVLRSSDKEASDPQAKAYFDDDRKQTVQWYAEFCYLFAQWLHGQGKVAVIGSWASGQPRVEDDAWRWWGRALQASADFGAIQAFHDYAGDTALSRVKYNNAEWTKLGYPNLRQIITELGVNEYGGGWKGLYANWSDCHARLIKPWLDAVYALPFEVDATWFTDGTGGNGAWDGLNVSGTNVVELLAAYVPPIQPERETMPISKQQQAQYLADLDTAAQRITDAQIHLSTTRAAIAALTPDDAAHWWDVWPAGAINPPRQLAALPTAIAMRDAGGVPLVPAIKRGNAMQVFERQGDLLRVLAAPINGQLWWVKAEDLPVPTPAG